MKSGVLWALPFFGKVAMICRFTYDGGTSEADFLTDQEWGSLIVPTEAIMTKEVGRHKH